MSSRIADPRPQAVASGGVVTITGWRCRDCAYPIAREVLRCPICRGGMEQTTFSPRGEVFASTCLRVGVPGHEPPFAMAYLILDDGPRVLVHTEGEEPLPVGGRAAVTSVTAGGDMVATICVQEAS
ncbi:OB-fold domain-containing protein [Microbispora sp. NBRC 16548]|uniref:OB-fold domain-containing protein n=1 Tax=Microbispora sp. NBRC 16548 TaxID=3030994 RepID=UPI001622B586|nr:OB-fold domain-containing protein [Microbispora sp. NBRC 16548]